MSRRVACWVLLSLVVAVTVGAAVALAAQQGRVDAQKPVNRNLPRIAGSPTVGTTLHAIRGHWIGASTFVYQWKRCNAHGANCTIIRGSHSARAPLAYTLTSADLGHQIRVTVIATNRHGRASATSRPTAVIRRKGIAKHPSPSHPSPAPSPSPSPTGSPSAAPGLHVVGNRLENAAGQRVVLHGTDVSGPGYQCERAGNGFSDTPSGDDLYGPMIGNAAGSLAQDWKINSVAIGLNQDCWLGLYGVNPSYSGQNYINFIQGEVASMERHGIYPVLGFGNGDPYGPPDWYGTNNGALPMPNNAHAALFWEEVASTFRSDPKVIFRLFEEPYPNWYSGSSNLTAWNCWSQGDVQYSTASVRTPPAAPVPVSSVTHCHEVDQENPGVGYATVGMQSLVNIIRGTGATNVIQIPGVSYANLLACDPHGNPTTCGFLDNNPADCTNCNGATIEVHDPVTPAELMADTDNYPDTGQSCGDVTCLTASYDPVAAVMPIEMGEAGSGSGGMSLIQQFIDHYDSLGQSYYASQWETWSGFITNYNGAPGAGFGSWYHDHIASLG